MSQPLFTTAQTKQESLAGKLLASSQHSGTCTNNNKTQVSMTAFSTSGFCLVYPKTHFCCHLSPHLTLAIPTPLFYVTMSFIVPTSTSCCTKMENTKRQLPGVRDTFVSQLQSNDNSQTTFQFLNVQTFEIRKDFNLYRRQFSRIYKEVKLYKTTRAK